MAGGTQAEISQAGETGSSFATARGLVCSVEQSGESGCSGEWDQTFEGRLWRPGQQNSLHSLAGVCRDVSCRYNLHLETLTAGTEGYFVRK
jgi:hypothetical protein